MLTEHRDKLKELFEHDNDVEKPILDEQQLEKLDILIKKAVQEQSNIKVLYYKDRRIQEYEGRITIKDEYLYLDKRKLFKDNIIDINLL